MFSKTIPWKKIEPPLQALGKDQAWFIKELNVSPSVITNWKARGAPKGEADRIATALQVTTDYLLDVARPISKPLAIAQDISRYGNDQPGYVRVPHLDVVGSMGYGAAPVDYPEVVREIDVLESFVREQFNVAPQHLRIMIGRGDSMLGTIDPGSLVFVDISVRQYNGDGIYTMVWKDQLLIKRLQVKQSESRLIIKSDNPVYEPDYLTHDQVDCLNICGRVVGSWNFKKLYHGL